MRKSLVIGVSLLFCLLANGLGLAQIKQETEERSIAIKRSLDRHSKFSSRVAVFSGYSSNPLLASVRKGDWFQEFLYSLDFSKTLSDTLKFTLDYDLDGLNYSEITDLTNVLNHLNLGIHKKYGIFGVGTGYDLGAVFYPRNDESNFLFHRGFMYGRHDISRNTYQKLEFQYGIKDYLERKATGPILGTIKDDKRSDKRWNAEYSLTSILTPKLLMRWRAAFSRNDSNSQYIDFHDFRSYMTALSLYYKLLKDLNFLSTLSYRRKDYDDRTVTGGVSTQEDDLYSATLGLLYKLNKMNSLSLTYTYRENSSNDPLEEYSENVVTCGYRYDF